MEDEFFDAESGDFDGDEVNGDLTLVKGNCKQIYTVKPVSNGRPK